MSSMSRSARSNDNFPCLFNPLCKRAYATSKFMRCAINDILATISSFSKNYMPSCFLHFKNSGPVLCTVTYPCPPWEGEQRAEKAREARPYRLARPRGPVLPPQPPVGCLQISRGDTIEGRSTSLRSTRPRPLRRFPSKWRSPRCPSRRSRGSPSRSLAMGFQ